MKCCESGKTSLDIRRVVTETVDKALLAVSGGFMGLLDWYARSC
jgi:hypothetical protein